MKTNGNLMKTLAILICVLSLTSIATAQKKRATPRKATAKPTATVAAAPASNLEIKEAADKVSIQVKNLTKFIFVLGGVAKDLEAIDADIKARKITNQTTIQQITKNQQDVVTTIKNLRAGLVALEIDFRAKPSLRTYVIHIGGISDAAANAEDLASAGRFTDSGRALLGIVEKLSDALAAMP